MSYISSHFKLNQLLILFVAVAIWLWIGFDGRLHWDEPSYLYTATYVSWQQILYEGFEPSGITGFNVSRLAHLAIIKCIAAITGPGPILIGTVIILYLAFLLGFATIGYF
ncbi:MAG: hypothetical protein RI580_19225, partial [Halothece sp. Uz-M2-17]|nr:hypothetical protein [Halothece sp. Uz-M2-17]